jgi:hypothetical protein
LPKKNQKSKYPERKRSSSTIIRNLARQELLNKNDGLFPKGHKPNLAVLLYINIYTPPIIQHRCCKARQGKATINMAPDDDDDSNGEMTWERYKMHWTSFSHSRPQSQIFSWATNNS